MSWIYRGIIAAIVVLIAVNMWREKRLRAQLAAGLVLVPLLLRLLMIK